MSRQTFRIHGLGIILSWLFLTILAGFLLSACVPAIPQAEAGFETPSAYVPAACRFRIRELRVECGDLIVPENYDNPQGPQINVHVAIIRSDIKEQAKEPLVVLFGGPGANALARLDHTTELFGEVLAERDVIVVDQRGVGYSEPSLNCPELDNFNLTVIEEQLDPEHVFARRLAVYGRCRRRLESEGIDLRSYSAESIAADVNQLRLALGLDGYHLFGVSYGARLGLIIMRDYPDGLRSVILDSVYPTKVDLAQETAFIQAHALGILFSETREDFPEFEGAFYDSVAELETSPIAVPVMDPRQEDAFYFTTFDGGDLLRLTIKLARWPQAHVHFPGLIEEIANGEYENLAHFLKLSVGDQRFSEGLNLSVNCQEIDPAGQVTRGDDALDSDNQLFDLAVEDVGQRIKMCHEWLGEDWSVPVQAQIMSDIPALVLVGGLDTLIPEQWSERATAGLMNRDMVVFPDTGHGVMASNPCAREAVAAFLFDPASMDGGCWQ